MQPKHSHGKYEDLEGQRIILVESNTILADTIERLLSAAGAQPIRLTAEDKLADVRFELGPVSAAVLELGGASPHLWYWADRLSKQGVPLLVYASHVVVGSVVPFPFPLVPMNAGADELMEAIARLIKQSGEHQCPTVAPPSPNDFEAALRRVRNVMNAPRNR